MLFKRFPRFLIGNPRKLWVRYAVAIGLIASLVTFSHIISLQATSTGDELSAAIDISGRQRMLSQRILFFASEVYSGRSSLNGTAKQELVNAIDLFERSHTALTQGNDLGLSGVLSPDLQALYFSDCNSCALDRRARDYILQARVVAGAVPGDADAAWQSLVSSGSTPLLTSLNEAVQSRGRAHNLPATHHRQYGLCLCDPGAHTGSGAYLPASAQNHHSFAR